MKRRNGPIAFLRTVQLFEEELNNPNKKPLYVFNNANDNRGVEDEADPLEWEDKEVTGWQTLLSIQFTNILAMSALLVAVVVLLGAISYRSLRQASDLSKQNTQDALDSCFSTADGTQNLFFQSTLVSVRSLAANSLSMLLERAISQVEIYTEAVVTRNMAAYRLMMDFNVDLRKWSPATAWDTGLGMRFLYQHLHTNIRSEPGVAAFHIMDTLNNSQAIYFYNETVYGARRSWIAAGGLTVGSHVSSFPDTMAAADTTAPCVPDADVCDTEMSFTWLPSYINTVNQPNGTYWWSEAWAYRSTLLFNNSFAISTPTAGVLRPVMVVSRAVTVEPIVHIMGDALGLIPTAGLLSDAVSEPIIFLLDFSGRVLGAAGLFSGMLNVSGDVNGTLTVRTVADLQSELSLSDTDTLFVRRKIIASAAREQLSNSNNGQYSGLQFGQIFRYTHVHEEYANSAWQSKEDMFTVARGIQDAYNLSWVLVVVSPVYYFEQNATVSNNENKKAMITTRRVVSEFVSVEQAASDKNTSRNEMLMVIIAISATVGGILVAVLFNIYLTRPLKRLLRAMKSVAYMDLDAVQDLRQSRLLEMWTLQECFKQMVKNLRHFKSFVPDAVFQEIEAEEEEPEAEPEPEPDRENAGPSGSRPGTADQSNAGRHQQGAAEPASARGAGSAIDSSSIAASSVAVKKPKKRAADLESIARSDSSAGKKKKKTGISLGLQLTMRKSTVIAVNMDRFNRLQKELGADDVVRLHTEYIAKLMEVIKANKGMADRFNGDRLFASWNTLVIQGGHKTMACYAAAQCVDAIAAVNAHFASEEFPPITIRVGIACGNLLSGNIGCDSLKCFSVIGVPVNICYALERLNKDLSTRILMDSDTHQAATYAFITRPVDVIEIADLKVSNPDDRSLNNMKVFELLGDKKEQQADEWMYQLEDQEKENAFQHYEDAFTSFVRTQLDKALGSVERHLANKPEDAGALRLKERIEARMKEGRPEGERYTHVI